MFDFKTFPTLTTERLILRELQPNDAPAVFRIRGDYEVTKYNTGAPYENVQHAVQMIDAVKAAYDKENELRWGITFKSHGNVIGMCGYNYWDRTDHRASIGYDLARDYWRQGIMTEALRAILAFGFEQMRLHRIEADASVYNEASIRLLRKLGFVQEGIRRDQYYEDNAYHDLMLFGLLAQEYMP